MKKLFFILLFVVFVSGCSTDNCAEKEIIATDNAPAAIGPYSQAVKVGNFLYLSGQLGINPARKGLVDGGLAAEARQALANQQAILKSAGFSLFDVVQCQVFLRDMEDYAEFNEIYKEFFKSDFPARAVVQVARLPLDASIEIMMVAAKDKSL